MCWSQLQTTKATEEFNLAGRRGKNIAAYKLGKVENQGYNSHLKRLKEEDLKKVQTKEREFWFEPLQSQEKGKDDMKQQKRTLFPPSPQISSFLHELQSGRVCVPVCGHTQTRPVISVCRPSWRLHRRQREPVWIWVRLLTRQKATVLKGYLSLSVFFFFFLEPRNKMNVSCTDHFSPETSPVCRGGTSTLKTAVTRGPTATLAQRQWVNESVNPLPPFPRGSDTLDFAPAPGTPSLANRCS